MANQHEIDHFLASSSIAITALNVLTNRFFNGSWAKREHGGTQSLPTRNPLWTPAGAKCVPFKMVESGMPACMEAGMRGCLEVSQDWEGFGDAALKDLGDCSCKLARSSSGRGRRILLLSYFIILLFSDALVLVFLIILLSCSRILFLLLSL